MEKVKRIPRKNRDERVIFGTGAIFSGGGVFRLSLNKSKDGRKIPFYEDKGQVTILQKQKGLHFWEYFGYYFY
ncbi:unnamed protein product [Lathyrus oleraceus]